jgi:hypothetical protein
MRTRPCSHICDPPHSLHSERRRPCSHICDPPHSLHRERLRPCSHICDPPHSLHSVRRRPCSHIDAPPHSLHSERRRPCSHIDAPPHSLHLSRRRPCGQALHTLHAERGFTPCSHGPWCFGAYFRFVPFLVDSSLRFSSTSAPSISGTGILTRGRHTVVIPPSRPVKCERTRSLKRINNLRFPRKDRSKEYQQRTVLAGRPLSHDTHQPCRHGDHRRHHAER